MPLISNVSSTLKRQHSSTQIVTPEQAKQNKSIMLNIVNTALDKFTENLSEGKVRLDSSLDLERLVKLALILSGEADSITGKPAHQSEQVEITDLSKVGQILDDNDPAVKAMFEKLYKGYNNLNDVD